MSRFGQRPDLHTIRGKNNTFSHCIRSRRRAGTLALARAEVRRRECKAGRCPKNRRVTHTTYPETRSTVARTLAANTRPGHPTRAGGSPARQKTYSAVSAAGQGRGSRTGHKLSCPSHATQPVHRAKYRGGRRGVGGFVKRNPNFPRYGNRKFPTPVHASASSVRTRPDFNFSLSRYELPRMLSVTA